MAGGGLAKRIPSWLKTELPDGRSLRRIRQVVASIGLNTICHEARCPNKAECFSQNSITFLILGRKCTRACGFCNVERSQPEAVDTDEPLKLVSACSRLGIDYVVITSVTRDDLADYGAGHFASCVRLLKAERCDCRIELLTPDFMGSFHLVDCIIDSGVDVFGHNVETVERLYPIVRDRACYDRSLGLLEYVKTKFPESITKSGLLLGLGETQEEVREALRQIRDTGCDIVTIGQYMQPSRRHLPVSDYVEPEIFEDLQAFAEDLGFIAMCGPRVRSSFGAKAAYHAVQSRRHLCE